MKRAIEWRQNNLTKQFNFISFLIQGKGCCIKYRETETGSNRCSMCGHAWIAKLPTGWQVCFFFPRVASRSVDFTISGGFRPQLAADLARVLSRSAYFGLVQSPTKESPCFRNLPVGGVARPLCGFAFFFYILSEQKRNVVGTVPDVHSTPNTISSFFFPREIVH